MKNMNIREIALRTITLEAQAIGHDADGVVGGLQGCRRTAAIDLVTPSKIGQDRRLCPWAVARHIKIIKTQQPFAALAAGIEPAEQGRAQIAPMQRSGGGGGKTAAVAGRS